HRSAAAGLGRSTLAHRGRGLVGAPARARPARQSGCPHRGKAAETRRHRGHAARAGLATRRRMGGQRWPVPSACPRLAPRPGRPLAWAGSYLAPLLKPRLEGSLGFDATARWTGAPGEQAPTVQLAALQVDDLKATEAGEKAAAAAWKKLSVSDAEADLAQHKL